MKKKLLSLFVCLAIIVSAYVIFASTDPNYTDNIGLWKPDADDRTAALADANDNWETIDDVWSGVDTIDWKPYFSYERTAALSTLGDGVDDWALKLRAATSADQPTGYVLRGGNIEGRVTTGGEATFIEGATITAYTRKGALEPAAEYMHGLMIECKANQGVTTDIIGEDIRMFRQCALEPSGDEIGLRIRNTNTNGTGIDSAIEIKSDYSGETDDFGYGIDMNSADIDTADIRLSNGATISQCYDVYSGTAVTNSVILGLPVIDDVASSGDHTDFGLKLRIDNTVDQPTAYNVRGLDVEARTSAGGENTNIQGANITAYTKKGASEPAAANMYALKAECKANQGVTAEIVGIDVRMFRQAAVTPSGDEVGLRIRNANTNGIGLDSAIKIKSDGSGEYDDFVAGVDMSTATIDQAQIVFSNGAKLFVGSAASENAVYAEVGTYDAAGSMYISSVGKVFIQVADNGANADWETVTSASVE